MSLPKPDLDSKTFDQLVEESRKLIPGYSTEWTDHNFSDPGVTLIDLFAWLSEIALYRTNLVTESHSIKYLKLLGVKPQPAKQAKVDLTFTSKEKKTLRKGTKVSTEENEKEVFFQLEDEIAIVPATLEKIVIYESRSDIYDKTGSNEKKNLFFAPFGNRIQKDSALYLGFVLNSNTASNISLNGLNLMCYLYEKDLTEIKKYGIEQAYKIENAGVKWEIWAGNEWNPVAPKDETEGFRKSGRIVFKELKCWKASEIIPEFEYLTPNLTPNKNSISYYWLRCVVENAYYEYPPRIEMIRLNTVSAVHGRKIEDDEEKRISNGLPYQVFKIRETPVLDKTLQVSIEEWTEVHVCEDSGPYNKHFVLNKEPRGIVFVGFVPPEGSIITIFKYLSEDGAKEASIVGCEEWISKGLPDKIYEFKSPPTVGITFKLSVEKEKWVEVHDFEYSGPYDKHFVLNKRTREIRFGNGKRGLIPPEGSIITILKHVPRNKEKEDSTVRSEDLIVRSEEWTSIGEEWISRGLPDQVFKLKKSSIPTCSSCEPSLTFKLLVDEKWIEVDDFEGSGPSDKHFVLDKEKGEIKFGDGLMGLIPPQDSKISVLKYITGGGEEGNLMPERIWKTDVFTGLIKNYLASAGGKEAQTIKEATEDFCRDLKTPYTAVTLKDFEELAKNTPGLRIASAKAIPNYDAYTRKNSLGSITIVVVPFTYIEIFEEPPEASEEFKKAVCVHLDKRRLLGTDIHVISPIYIKVSVNVTVVPMDSFRDDNQIREKVLKKLTHFLHPITGGVDEKGWPIGRNIYLSELYDIIENIEGVNCILRLSISGDKGASTDLDGNLMLNSKLASIYSDTPNIEIVRETIGAKGGDNYSGK